MLALKRGIDAKGHCLIEMPSGTGKTATILSLVVAYMIEHPQLIRKLIYCSRTIPEVEKVVAELKNLMEYYDKNAPVKHNMTGVVLSSRKNMCIHPVVKREREGKAVDAMCFSMTAQHVRDRYAFDQSVDVCKYFFVLKCMHYVFYIYKIFELGQYFEGFSKDGNSAVLPPGVYNLDDMKQYGEERNWCPYFLSRFTISYAQIIVYSYYYLLDPKIAEIVSKELPKQSVVICDEAHNIDNVCIDSLSVKIGRRTIESSLTGLNALEKKVHE